MSDIDDLRRQLEARWLEEDARERHQADAIRHLTDEYTRLHETVRRLEFRVDGANELATRTSKSAFSLEDVVLAKLVNLQNDFEASRAELKESGRRRRTENLVGYGVIAALVVVGALVAAGKIPVESFAATFLIVGGAVISLLGSRKKPDGNSIPPKRG